MAEAEISLLSRAMRKILGNYSQRIRESVLSLFKGDSMLGLILEVLLGIPIESNRRHATRIAVVVGPKPYKNMAHYNIDIVLRIRLPEHLAGEASGTA